MCRRSCSLAPVMPAALLTIAQSSFSSTRWPVAPCEGNTNSASSSALAFSSVSSWIAAGLKGTRCSVFCFVVAPGFVHTPARDRSRASAPPASRRAARR